MAVVTEVMEETGDEAVEATVAEEEVEATEGDEAVEDMAIILKVEVLFF